LVISGRRGVGVGWQSTSDEATDSSLTKSF
jgi:hypothetical protein